MLSAAATELLQSMRSTSRYIANLGHGLMAGSKLDNLIHLVGDTAGQYAIGDGRKRIRDDEIAAGGPRTSQPQLPAMRFL